MYKTLFIKNGYELVLFMPRHRVKRIREPFRVRLKKWLISLFPASEQIKKYGTHSLRVWDDRTKREKFNDRMREYIYYFDNLAFNRKMERANKLNRLFIRYKNFTSFFDTTNNEMVSSMSQIREREKSGQVMLTHREAQDEFKRHKKFKEDAFDRKSTEQFKGLYQEMMKGQSFAKNFTGRVDYNQQNLRKVLE